MRCAALCCVQAAYSRGKEKEGLRTVVMVQGQSVMVSVVGSVTV